MSRSLDFYYKPTEMLTRHVLSSKYLVEKYEPLALEAWVLFSDVNCVYTRLAHASAMLARRLCDDFAEEIKDIPQAIHKLLLGHAIDSVVWSSVAQALLVRNYNIERQLREVENTEPLRVSYDELSDIEEFQAVACEGYDEEVF